FPTRRSSDRGVGGGVVGVADGGVAVRAGAHVVAQEDEPPELAGELSGPALGGDESAVGGVGPQPAVEHAGGFGEVPAGDGCGDGPVAGDPGRLLTVPG